MSLVEIEQLVESLPADQFAEFSRWLEDLAARRWERQFESDVAAGKLDRLGEKALAEFGAGRCTAL
jgi:hypothetical protein